MLRDALTGTHELIEEGVDDDCDSSFVIAQGSETYLCRDNGGVGLKIDDQVTSR